MIEFFTEYGLFLLKVVTVVLGIIAIISAVTSAGRKGSHEGLEVENLNKKHELLVQTLKMAVLNKSQQKSAAKDKKKKDKASAKEVSSRPRSFVIDFKGDLKASAVPSLRQEVNAILDVATPDDEVIVRLENYGGVVHEHGLAASQLVRIRDKNIPLTICVDKVAASGGYLMSCVASKIIAAPWAIVGSIGVIAQLPNFHRLLKKNSIDFEMHTAGAFKRTLTTLGENTDEGRKKFKSDLEDLHLIFKDFVKEQRPQVDTDVVATGEVWQGKEAIEVGLIDSIETSDNYLVGLSKDVNLFEIEFVEKKNLSEKFAFSMHLVLEKLVLKFYDLINRDRFLS